MSTTTTPKNEAKRLINEFEIIINESDFHLPKFIASKYKSYKIALKKETNYYAIVMALNTVNNILNVTKFDDYERKKNTFDKEFWLKVKEILNKKI